MHDALDALKTLPSWEQRFEFVVDLAAELPPMPAALKTEATKVAGCTSQVWMHTAWDQNQRLRVSLDSDAVLVKGLLALVWLAYEGKTQPEAAVVNLPSLLEPTGLLANLSPNRRNGFASVVGKLQQLVSGCV